MTPNTLIAMREVNSRKCDGIHVRLLWHELTKRVAVAVDDTKTGEAFTIEVAEGERAVDVFNHPFAYAATASA